MRVTLEHLTSEDAVKIRNFYKTFGFLVITGALSKKEIKDWRREFTCLYAAYFQKPFWKLCRKLRSAMVPSFADRSDFLLSWLDQEKILAIPKMLLGEHCIYWGSDGSLFFAGSAWHRDMFTQAPQMKMNVYLQNAGPHSGALRLIPGSHKVGDAYAAALGQACAWPGTAPLGGLSETGVFAQSTHPGKLGIVRFLTGFRKNFIEMPHHIVTAKAGDIIIFDERLVHCVYGPPVPRMRKLVTFLFSGNAQDLPEAAPELRQFTRESMDSELRELKAFDCRMYCAKAYGEKLRGGGYKNIAQHLLPEPEVTIDASATFSGYRQGFSAENASFLRRNYWKDIQ